MALSFCFSLAPGAPLAVPLCTCPSLGASKPSKEGIASLTTHWSKKQVLKNKKWTQQKLETDKSGSAVVLTNSVSIFFFSFLGGGALIKCNFF